MSGIPYSPTPKKDPNTHGRNEQTLVYSKFWGGDKWDSRNGWHIDKKRSHLDNQTSRCIEKQKTTRRCTNVPNQQPVKRSWSPRDGSATPRCSVCHRDPRRHRFPMDLEPVVARKDDSFFRMSIYKSASLWRLLSVGVVVLVGCCCRCLFV